MPILEVSNIHKTFGKTKVLKDINFTLEKGEVVSIIGSSGSGKTTLLRCLNFLETPDTGIIRVNERCFLMQQIQKRSSSHRFEKRDCILDWFFRALICFHSIQPWKM